MVRRRHSRPNSDLPRASIFVRSSAGLCARRQPRPGRGASAFSSLSWLIFSLPCKTSAKINPWISYSSALFKKQCFDNPLYINTLRALLQNTGGGTHSPKIFSHFFSLLATRHSSLATKSRRICTYVKSASNPFTIRTSKTQDLKSFRIRTYEKTGVGGPSPLRVFPFVRVRNGSPTSKCYPCAFPFGNALSEMEA